MVATAGLRVVFFGTPEFALPSLDALLASRHHVVAVVTQPDRPRGRGHKTTIGPVKVRGEAAGLPILQPERLKDQLFLDALSAWAPTSASSRRTARSSPMRCSPPRG
jgi:methionyl-tRNA formyltransferase